MDRGGMNTEKELKRIEEYIFTIEKSALFAGMSREAILKYLQESEAKIVYYDKDEMIFRENDMPTHMQILVEGSVAICNDNGNGKRGIVAMIENPGDIFGEIFVFLNHKEYDHYAQVMNDALVLQIPKEYFFYNHKEDLESHARITSNLLGIFANKTYYLNQRLNILLCGNLRQKLARIFLRDQKDYYVRLRMNREEMADFVNTARPSLSRELMSMQEDGLIHVEKRMIYIRNLQGLKDLL